VQCLLYHIIINKSTTNIYNSYLLWYNKSETGLRIWAAHYHTERWRRNNDRASGLVQRCGQFLQSGFTTYLQVPFYVMGKKIIYIYKSGAIASNKIRDHATSYTKCVNFSQTLQKCWNYSDTTLMRLLRKERGYRLDALGLKPRWDRSFYIWWEPL
jgi:hypothetical protein